jgi:hypothetical protein
LRKRSDLPWAPRAESTWGGAKEGGKLVARVGDPWESLQSMQRGGEGSGIGVQVCHQASGPELYPARLLQPPEPP